MKKMIEFHVSGYKSGRYFREIFSNEESARNFAEKFKRWNNHEGDFCHILKCEVETFTLWEDI